MNKYLKIDPWKIIEENFDSKNSRSSESLFSLGNGYMGQRASFEEAYSGDRLLGNYMAGVYYPDPTKVGWWKNGYPEYYARQANITNYLGIDVIINDEPLDLAKCKVTDFVRTLNMREGYLERSFVAEFTNGNKIKVVAQRFISMIDKKICAIKYSVAPLNFSGKLSFVPALNTDVHNESSNWGEKFIEEVSKQIDNDTAFATIKVRRSNYEVCSGFCYQIAQNGQIKTVTPEPINKERFVGLKINLDCTKDSTTTIYKYVANVTTRDYAEDQLQKVCKQFFTDAKAKGYEAMLNEHKAAWLNIWKNSDVTIEGDEASQQSIRFNIFQLAQTYTGEDARLNVGPKGFTGEKYGATTQWDSEAYCVPFYLCTANAKITKNLLLYRYNHLQAAIENAKLVGFKDGAAFYPMATVDGKEGQNEWEITFEEIHRNGSIAYAIYSYINYTGDESYLADYGIPVLVGVSRFWSQRATFSEIKNKYVILGVTGPNEYENNVNNNWHTNNIACWTLGFTIDSLKKVKKSAPEKYAALIKQLQFDEKTEIAKWQEIIDNMFFAIEEKTGAFLQQEGYMDKEQIMVKDLDPAIRPINQHWSWDRILRSCFIKQADVLQSIYFFMDKYDSETIKKNYDFYEPRTVHESSLSPCIHAILAARINYLNDAYTLFLRATRLDLDDYNSEAAEGCHITSMAGSWLVVAQGFGGMWIKNGELQLNPVIIDQWKAYSFNTTFGNKQLNVRVTHKDIAITNLSDAELSLMVHQKKYTIAPNSKANIPMR